MMQMPALADRHVPTPGGIRRCIHRTATILAPLVILLLVALTATAARAAETMPTFAEWQAACAKLPLNRVLAGRMPPKALLPLRTFAEFDRVLDAFFALATNGPLANATHWVGTDRNIRVANGIHVENFAKLGNVVIAKVKLHRQRITIQPQAVANLARLLLETSQHIDRIDTHLRHGVATLEHKHRG